MPLSVNNVIVCGTFKMTVGNLLIIMINASVLLAASIVI